MNMGNEIFNLSVKISSQENYNRILDSKILENKSYINDLLITIDEHKYCLNETIDILISHYEFLEIYSLSDVEKLKYIREIKIDSII